ncbi:MAG TPA: alpha/beta-type small acid-soluble spore protein [Bacilli bacterium]
MARKKSRTPVVPEARRGLNLLKMEVMRREGYVVDPGNPERVKYAVAQSIGIPLKPQNNGNLTTEQAGKIGGQIGGAMVREMVRLAQQQLTGKNARN